MDVYIVITRNPKVNVWGVAFAGRVFTEYYNARLMLDFYQREHPKHDAKIIIFNIDKE